MNRNTSPTSSQNSSANDTAAITEKAWTDDKRHKPIPSSAGDDVQKLILKANSSSGGGLVEHPMSNDRLMLKSEVLRYIPVSSKTWDRWMKDGTAPRYFKIGRQNFWKASDVHAWIEAHI